MNFTAKSNIFPARRIGAPSGRPHPGPKRLSRKTAFACSILALFCLARSVFPQAEEGLTIEKTIETALARNPEVLAATAEVEASRGRSLQSSARPEAQLTADLGGMSLPGARTGGETEINLSFEQPIEFPGKRSMRVKIGRYGVDLAEAELERIKLVITARVKRAYWKAAFAKSAALALEKSGTRLDLLLADLQAKYRSGTAAYADILRTRAEQARLRNQVLEQENERRSAGLELNDLLSLPADAPVALLTAMTFSPLSADLSKLLEASLLSRPSHKAASLRRERAAAALKLARAGNRPDFVAGLSLPSMRSDAWGVSFGLTLPFLQPGRGRGLTLEASAEAEIARLMADSQDRRIRSALEIAYSSLKTAEAQVQVFEQSLLRELEDELRIQVEYYRYGKVDFYNLLDLHRTYVMAELDHLRAVLLFNLALADLEVAGEELP